MAVIALNAMDACKHPTKDRVTPDSKTQQQVCEKCGVELPSLGIKVTSEKFGRAPGNAALFAGNLGSTTRRKDDHGPEHHHLEAISAVYGSRNGSKIPLDRLIKTCPSCLRQQVVRVFGETVRCENPDCQIQLAHFVLRWLPFVPNGKKNGDNGNVAIHARFSADLRLLQLWDPPEGDPTLKLARDLFRKKVFGHMQPEDAHFLAKRFLRGVRQLNKVYRKDMENLLDSLLEGEGIIIR